MKQILFKDETYAIQGAVYEVYYHLGHGFLESVYQEALEKELLVRNIPFISQYRMNVRYKDDLLKHYYKSDFLCYGKIIMEIKSEKCSTARDRAQVLNYLKASGCQLGLLVNFGSYPKVGIDRMILT